MKKETFQMNVEDIDGQRIDAYLADHMELSRSYIQKLIKNENVSVNGKSITKVKIPVSFGDEIQVEIPEPEALSIEPEPMDLDILYEDDDIIIVNKPKDMVVHPAAGHMRHTLVNGLLYHCKGSLSGINGITRPGIVHRIDKDTTGALVVCKNDAAHISLAKQLEEHTITRKYNAIVYHNFREEEGTVAAPIGRHPADRKKMAVVPDEKGKHAVTHYRVLSHLNHEFNHIECQLETGRTHQIRVHMAYIRHPLLGDALYGPAPKKTFHNLQGQSLHARVIGFRHPTQNQYIEVEAPLPQYFVHLLESLEK